jgi:hypothetical protein
VNTPITTAGGDPAGRYTNLTTSLLLTFVTLILFCTAPFAYAQKAKSEAPAYASITSLMLSPEKIKEKIKDTESDKELEQGLKNKLLGQYRNAINSIEMATAYDFYALSYTQSLKSAPAEEEKVNRLLQEMDVKPKTLSTKDLARFSTADQERR